jgi:uncharacterized membrane protein YphA (DoxX/SURF4 family)
MSDASNAGPGPLRTLALVAAMLVGVTLIFSAITKILAPKAFVTAVETYGLLPPSLVLPGATGLVGAEVALGLLLVLGFRRRAAAWLSFPLLVFFTGMVIHAMRAGLPECGCFGEVIKLAPAQELVVDVVLLVLTLLVLWKGEDVTAGRGLGAPLGWISLCAGAALFLAAGPVVGSESELPLERADLDVLAAAQPPLVPADEAFLFLFSADCDHCWAYVGGVELMQRRLEGIEVHAVTFSDPQALEEFEAAFEPTFPIHVVNQSVFDGLTAEYPAAVWISGGEVLRSWAGYVPSHREIAEQGGYLYREPTAPTPTPAASPGTDSGSLFGGPVRGRH